MRSVWFVAWSCLIAGCGPSGFELEPAILTLSSLGESGQLEPQVANLWGDPVEDAVITWTSSDPHIVDVDPSGTVEALEPGSAIITAETANRSASALVVVRQRAAEVAIVPHQVRFSLLREERELSIEANDALGNPIASPLMATWTTSDSDIARVDGAMAIASGYGEALVTAELDGVEATAVVLVQQEAMEVEVTPESALLYPRGATQQLVSSAWDVVGDPVVAGVDMVWTSADNSIATVDQNGVVTAGRDGTTEVTAWWGDASSTATVRVGYDCFEDLEVSISYARAEAHSDSYVDHYLRFDSPPLPDQMFAEAPDLPPCGLNPRSARTHIMIHDNEVCFLYGYCGLRESPTELRVPVPADEPPPEQLYVVVEDRRCGLDYTSNLVVVP